MILREFESKTFFLIIKWRGFINYIDFVESRDFSVVVYNEEFSLK